VARSKPTPARARKTPKPVRAKTPIRQQESARPTVLLVDDDPKVRSSIRRLLEKLEYRVIEAEDADSALALIASAKNPTDLVLTDIVLQGMSGRELAVRLSIEHPGVRLLLMSGYSADTMQLKEGEVAKFLHKPISLEALAARVAGALRDES
jgi:two-component system, cell cycle sensor histidine kinase and response regulator CckA